MLQQHTTHTKHLTYKTPHIHSTPHICTTTHVYTFTYITHTTPSTQATARGFVPLLIINLQVPLYNPSYFGAHDGEGGSIIYFFTFPPGWHPDAITNPAARQLLEAFFNDGLCGDGTPARERLKLIPRVANVDEWAKVGPLTATEHKLLSNYNDKPVLTRPQQRFYRGPGYLEVRVFVCGGYGIWVY